MYRLAELSVNIIDQCVAQGVPFAREYGGLLDNRSFGGAQVSRTFYARGQTGQQLLLGAYQALAAPGAPRHGRAAHPHRDARPRASRTAAPSASSPATSSPARCSRSRRTRSCSRPAATATCSSCPRTPRLSNVDRDLAGAPQAARSFANPCFTQIHPTCIPRERRLPVEAHADERVAAQRRPRLGPEAVRRRPLARPDPRGRARLLPRAPVPGVRQPRAARRRVARDQARGRRRARRRPAEERRVPRLRRGDRSASATT